MPYKSICKINKKFAYSQGIFLFFYNLVKIFIKIPLAVFLCGDIYISTLGTHIIEKIGESDVHIEQHGVAYENEIQTGAGESHVQLAVDYHAVLLKHVVGEEVELVGLLDCKTIDDEVALTALITLHGVDGDVVQARDAISVYLVAHG